LRPVSTVQYNLHLSTHILPSFQEARRKQLGLPAPLHGHNISQEVRAASSQHAKAIADEAKSVIEQQRALG
jgi:hypothetical protein